MPPAARSGLECMRPKNVGIEDEHAGCAKTLAGHAIVSVRGEPPGGDQAAPGERANDHLHRWRNEIVIEGILDQKDDAEEEDEPADPGESFTPMKASQSIAGRGALGGTGTGGGAGPLGMGWTAGGGGTEADGTTVVGSGGGVGVRGAGVGAGCAGAAEDTGASAPARAVGSSASIRSLSLRSVVSRFLIFRAWAITRANGRITTASASKPKQGMRVSISGRGGPGSG